MRKSIILLSSCLFLCGCNNEVSSSNENKTFLSNDIQELISFNGDNPLDYPFELDKQINKSLTHENFYVVTVTIAYKEVTINNFKSIVIPYSLNIIEASNLVANVGYSDEKYTLGSKDSSDPFTFPGFRISYLTKDNEDGVKILVKGDDCNYKFSYQEI